MPVTTLRDLREQAAKGFALRSYADGAVATTGTGGFLPDPQRQEPAGDWSEVDAFILFTSAPNDSVVRRVTAYTVGSGLTFAPSLATAVPSGATYQLFKDAHPIEDWNVSINEALKELGNHRVVSIATTAEVADNRRVSVPSAAGNPATRLLGVERSVGTTGSPWQYDPLRAGTDYDVVTSDGATWLELKYIPVQDTLLRFTYEREATELVVDTDATAQPALLVKALARKYKAAAKADDAGVKRWTLEAEHVRDLYPQQSAMFEHAIPRIGA